MNKLRMKSVLFIAKTEYVKWISNPRIILVGMLFLCMKTLAVEPLLERAEKMGGSLNLLEPFAAIGNSGMLVMLMPCVFLALVSDYPAISGNTLFIVSRTGKKNWFWGQMIFILAAIVSYIGAILLAGVLLSKGRADLAWSEVVRKYTTVFPEEANNYASKLLPSNLYNQIPLPAAVLQTIVLMGAYLFSLVLILYFFKLIQLQSAGIFAVFVVIGLGAVTCALKSAAMWIFPMANTISWMHYEEILRKPVYPVGFSFLYFAVVIFLLVAANAAALRKMQLMNVRG